MTNPIVSALEEQRSRLAVAKDKVAALEARISALEGMLRDEDDFDRALTSAVSKQSAATTPHDDLAHLTEPTEIHAPAHETLEATLTGRNPRGAVRGLLMSIMADGVERDLDQLEAALSGQTPNKVTRGALRTTLMALKNAGLVTSRKPGVFQARKKEPPLVGGGGATMSTPVDNIL